MKKLFVLLAIFALTTTFALADATGTFKADFYCVPTLTGPTATADLGNYFISNDPQAAGGTTTLTFTFSGVGDKSKLTYTGKVEGNTTNYVLDGTWSPSGSWTGDGVVTTWSNRTDPIDGGDENCEGVVTVVATATYVTGKLIGTHSWTVTVTGTVTI